MFFILHSGQTGVERGAHDGALAAGFRVAGFMTATGRDELGPVPEHVATHLQKAPQPGPRAAVRANLAIAHAAMIVVPKVNNADSFPAMDWIMRGVRRRGVPLLVCDPQTDAERVATWALELREQSVPCHVLVTGPRATRWQEGEDLARRMVRRLALIDEAVTVTAPLRRVP